MILNEYRTKKTTDDFEDPKQEVIYTDAWLVKQWRHYNEKFFEGKLKRPKLICWEKKKSRYGVCGGDFDGKKYYTSYIKITQMDRNYISIRSTLVHEMVHQWVNETYVTKDTIKMANAYGKAKTRPWWNYIKKAKGDGSDAHHGTWLRKCEELMKIDPTLALTKYGDFDRTQLTDKEVKKVVQARANTHIVVQEGDPRTPRRHFYYLSEDAYKNLLKRIEDNSVGGEWTEYKFDPEKLAQVSIKVMDYAGNSYYTGTFFDNLCERGIISRWDYTKLGGEKTVHHRKKRRSLFDLWG